MSLSYADYEHSFSNKFFDMHVSKFGCKTKRKPDSVVDGCFSNIFRQNLLKYYISTRYLLW